MTEALLIDAGNDYSGYTTVWHSGSFLTTVCRRKSAIMVSVLADGRLRVLRYVAIAVNRLAAGWFAWLAGQGGHYFFLKFCEGLGIRGRQLRAKRVSAATPHVHTVS